MLDFKRNRHSCYMLKYHLVIVTKFENNIINKEILERLKEIFAYIMEDSWKCTILEFNGESNYIHVLFEAPPQVELAKLINNLKTVSSRRVRKEFEAYLNNFYSEPAFWNNSYLVITDGESSINLINQYLETFSIISR